MQEELRLYAELLQEVASDKVVPRYSADSLPYGWEIQRQFQPNGFIWLGTIRVGGVDILALYALAEDEQRVFLNAKLAASIGHC